LTPDLGYRLQLLQIGDLALELTPLVKEGSELLRHPRLHVRGVGLGRIVVFAFCPLACLLSANDGG
jgi:hypothetical protein